MIKNLSTLFLRRLFKNITLLLIIASVGELSSFAQQAKIDSLLAMLKKTRADTNRVNTLLTLSKEYTNLNPSKALEYGTGGFDLANTLSFYRGVARACIRLGYVYVAQGKLKEAQAQLEKGLKLSEEQNEALTRVQALSALSDIMRKLGKMDKALSLGQEALKVAESSYDKSGIALALNIIGNIHYVKGQYNHALATYQRSMKLRDEIGDKGGVARSLINIGLIHSNQGRYEQAKESFRRCLEIQEALDSKNGIADALVSIGLVSSKQGRYDEALEYYKQSLKLQEEIGNKTGVAGLLSNIGVVHTNQGRYEQALEYYLRSLKLREEIGNRLEIAATLNNIGTIHLDQGRYEQAREYYERSLKMREEIGDKAGIVKSLTNLGVIHHKQGRYEQALEYHQRSLKLQEEIGDKEGVEVSLNNIGNIHYKQSRLNQALDYYQRSLKLAEELDDKLGVAMSLNNIGIVSASQGSYDTAITFALRCDVIAKKIGNTRMLMDVSKTLSEAYFKKGDIAKSLEYFKEFTSYKDSLLNEANIKSINEMNAKYESERKDNEIKLLEKDKALTASELERKQKELAVQLLESERNRQRAELRTTELELKTTALELEKTEKEKKASEVKVLSKDYELKVSEVSREKTMRNSVLVGVGLLLIVGFLSVKRIQDKKQEATLRAEAAEYQAQAAEAQTLAVSMEAEKREKELHQKFSWELLESQEQERKRIAGELHDGVGQEVMVMKNQLYLVLKNENIHPHAKERLEQVTSTATSLLEEVRRISRNLRPAQLDELGLTEALQALLQKVKDTAPFTLTHNIESIDGLIDREKEINVYRIVQEGMNNILKHSEAKNANVLLTRSNGSIVLQLQDDGKGFDAKERSVKWGFGLKNISERVAILGGEMKLNSGHGSGTRIDIVLPVHVLAA